MSQKLAGVKGMNDTLPGEVEIWQHLEATAREVLRVFGFSELRTPVLEDTALFVRGVGEGTDIVGKEMYTFLDKGGRSLSLRPEGTAPAARAYIEHSIQAKDPVTRWFYMGPMFRYERMKTGRYRQFSQLGGEVYGVKEPAADAEVIDLMVQYLDRLGLVGVTLDLNSIGDDVCRPDFQKRLVEFLNARRSELCGECQSRLERNPLRVLDCKNPECQKIVAGAPSIVDSLCAPCREHFDELKRLLDGLGIKYRLNPRLVRGLDYYTRTAFEFIAEDPVLGTAGSVCGGGRYDKLVESLGGPDVPAVGFAFGLDRLCLLVSRQQKDFRGAPALFLVSVDPNSQRETLKLASRLRREGVWVELDARGGSLKSQMKRADKSAARYAMVVGEEELRRGSAQLKPMTGGEPREVRFDELSSAVE